jgi:hypothetical protein
MNIGAVVLAFGALGLVAVLTRLRAIRKTEAWLKETWLADIPADEPHDVQLRSASQHRAVPGHAERTHVPSQREGIEVDGGVTEPALAFEQLAGSQRERDRSVVMPV